MISFHNHLMETRTKEELAKEVVKLAKERVELLNRVAELEHENFWMKVKERQE